MRLIPATVFFVFFLSCENSLVQKKQQPVPNNKNDSAGLIKATTYHQGDSLDFSEFIIYGNNKFFFNDMRDESCWLWQEIWGNWTFSHDTLIVSWESDKPDTNKFVIRNDSLVYVGPYKKNSFRNWGNFFFYSDAYTSDPTKGTRLTFW